MRGLVCGTNLQDQYSAPLFRVDYEHIYLFICLLTYSLTYLLTRTCLIPPWSRVILEKLTVFS